MVSTNPFGDFRKDCEKILTKSFSNSYPSTSVESFLFNIPPNPKFGELSSAVFFELGKKMEMQPLALAKQVVDAVEVEEFLLVKR